MVEITCPTCRLGFAPTTSGAVKCPHCGQRFTEEKVRTTADWKDPRQAAPHRAIAKLRKPITTDQAMVASALSFVFPGAGQAFRRELPHAILFLALSGGGYAFAGSLALASHYAAAFAVWLLGALAHIASVATAGIEG